MLIRLIQTSIVVLNNIIRVDISQSDIYLVVK